MSNNKQSSIDYIFRQLAIVSIIGDKNIEPLARIKYNLEVIDKYKQLHKKETIDFALHCMMPKMNPDKSTIEVVSDIYDEVFGGDQ